MVSIALRAYNNDIGDMIDHQQIAESISHCRHILQTFPKHVDTYRLLGKAYLEEKRYGDASDILQRVLSSTPEDFIAHVGMSIIREDEGNLDAAIYHMERAFETQPSNHAIQEELRRLHTSRDGVEPARIRLTRGALARMYAHGHLYDQAIAELQAALSEDSQRFDLQTLLADMYYQTDKKVDAAETCTKILEKLPFCLKANQLLTIILEENDRADDAQRYRQKWEALDPYAAFIDSDYTTPEMVPENRITIERLEWEPDDFLEDQEGQPAWASSLGVSIDRDEDREEGLPSWLGGDLTSDDEDLPGFEEEEDFVDDFFSKDQDTGAALFDDTEDEAAPEDWLIEPSDEDDLGLFGDEAEETQTEAGEEEDFDFLAGLQADSDEEEPLPDFLSGESTDQEDWMAEFAVPEDTEKDDTLEIKDDRLTSLDADVDAQEEDDWLASLGAGLETEQEDTYQEDDWFAALETDEQEQPAIPEAEDAQEEDDWLASLGIEQETEEAEEVEQEDDWFAALETDEQEQPTLPEAEEAQEEDDWLASLGAGQETEEQEEVGQEDDWLAALDSEEQELPTIPEAEEAQEDDDWLASIGAEQEAEETDGDEEIELPEFLKEAGWEKSTGDVDETAQVEIEDETDQPDEITAGDIPDWIREMAPSEDSQPDAPRSEFPVEADPEWLEEIEQQQESAAPDWLSELDETQAEAEEEAQEEAEEYIHGKQIEADDMDMAWLENLAAKQGIPDEELVTSPEQRAEVSEKRFADEAFPEEQSAEEEQEESPDWLSGLDADEAQPAEEAVQAVLEDEDDFDMDWLDEIGQQAADEAAATSLDAVPAEEAEEAEQVEEEDWMAALDEQPVEDESPDWLSSLEADEAQPAEEAVQAVLEDEDDFDMDWLDEIGQQAADEAAATSLDAAPAEEAEQVEQEEDWMAALDEQPGEEESPDWLSSLEADEAQPAEEAGQAVLDDEAAEIEEDWMPALDEQPEEEESPDWLSSLEAEEAQPAEEAVKAVRDEEDDFDTGWLDEIGQQAADEAAATSIEEPIAEELEDLPGDETAAWLSSIESEFSDEQILDDSTTGEFLSSMQGQTTEEADQEDISEQAEQIIEDETEEIEMDWQTETSELTLEEIQPAEDELAEVIEQDESYFDQFEPQEESLSEQAGAEEEVVPTQSEEWQPESQLEARVLEEAQPETESLEPPPATAPDSPQGIFEIAQVAAEKGDLEEALKGFNKLVKKGKLVDEVIHEISEALRRYPVNVELWQILGDAYLRQDNLKEALDAYTKAEELLR